MQTTLTWKGCAVVNNHIALLATPCLEAFVVACEEAPSDRIQGHQANVGNMTFECSF
jgi:hypothetical protein